jgi:UDP-glucuronate 4-epimerase
MSRVLVTGAGGVIGSQVVDYLARRGHQVTGTWRHERARLGCAQAENVDLIEVDLADASALNGLMASKKFDAVIHAAAVVDTGNSADWLKRSVHDNVQSHANLVSAALKAGCPRFLFCSTISVYGGVGAGSSGYLETDAAPVDIYGWSKLAGEQLLDLATGIDSGFTAVSLRLAGVHGGARKNGALYAICAAARLGQAISLENPNSRFRWLLIEDLLAAFNTLLLAPLAGGHYVCNLASADSFTLMELAQQIKQLAASSSPIETRGSVARSEIMNIERARALWGYAPTTLDTFLPGYLRGFAAQA